MAQEFGLHGRVMRDKSKIGMEEFATFWIPEKFPRNAGPSDLDLILHDEEGDCFQFHEFKRDLKGFVDKDDCWSEAPNGQIRLLAGLVRNSGFPGQQRAFIVRQPEFTDDVLQSEGFRYPEGCRLAVAELQGHEKCAKDLKFERMTIKDYLGLLRETFGYAQRYEFALQQAA